MSTIEERLKDLIDQQTTALSAMTNPHATGAVMAGRLEIRDTTRAAIIAGWNAALEAMKATAHNATINHSDGDRQCRFCRYRTGRETGHWPWCPLPLVVAALAQMEGTDA